MSSVEDILLEAPIEQSIEQPIMHTPIVQEVLPPKDDVKVTTVVKQDKQTSKKQVKESKGTSIQPIHIKFAIITLVCVAVVCIIAYFLIRHQQNKLKNKDVELNAMKQARDKAKLTIDEQQRLIDERDLMIDQQKKALTSQQKKLKEYEEVNSRQGPSPVTFNFDNTEGPTSGTLKIDDDSNANKIKQPTKQQQIQRMVNSKRRTNEDMFNATDSAKQQDDIDKQTQSDIKKMVHDVRVEDITNDQPQEEDDDIPIAINDDIITAN